MAQPAFLVGLYACGADVTCVRHRGFPPRWAELRASCRAHSIAVNWPIVGSVSARHADWIDDIADDRSNPIVGKLVAVVPTLSLAGSGALPGDGVCTHGRQRPLGDSG